MPSISGKQSKEKAQQRKKSSDQRRHVKDLDSPSTGIFQLGGDYQSTAKNLLEEFEKDDTLEPNMQMLNDGTSKFSNVDNRNRVASFEGTLGDDQGMETRQNNLQRPKEEMTTADREAY